MDIDPQDRLVELANRIAADNQQARKKSSEILKELVDAIGGDGDFSRILDRLDGEDNAEGEDGPVSEAEGEVGAGDGGTGTSDASVRSGEPPQEPGS